MDLPRLVVVRPSRALVALVAVVGLGLLPACGGDDDGEADGGSSGTSQEDGADAGDGGSTGPEDICAEVTAEEVSTAMGTSGLTLQEVPGGGCTFSDADDPVQPSVTLNQVPVDDANGGFDGLRAGVTATIDGEVEELDGVGDDAFAVVGSLGGGSALNGGGAVLLGDVGVQATLVQALDLPADEVRQKLVDVLTLVGDVG